MNLSQYEKDLFADKKLGFFIYLGVEAVMFLTLFITYLNFTPSSEGPAPSDFFSVVTVVMSSIFLLSSSGTVMLAEKGIERAHDQKTITWIIITLILAVVFLVFEINVTITWLIITLILAVVFLVFEINEFSGFLLDGYGISTSSFLTSYYVLVGLHAAHVLFGCGWMIILLIQLKGIHIPYHLFVEKFKIFSYYWHFVDIVWIFIILFVYAKYLI